MPLHPTPLYSIRSNIVIGVVVLRLWSLEVSFGLVAGVYLILTGIARFVEESYRGEPQTPVFAKLPIYQWMAMLSPAAGVAVTTIHGGRAAGLSLFLDWTSALAGLLYGAIVGFAMGVDFPASTRRFARLAPP